MITKVKKAVGTGVSLLANPKAGFTRLNKLKLEDVVSDYLIMLVMVGVVAGLASMIFFLIKALYLDLFLVVDINYWRLFNYSLGRTTSIIFLYIFAGTFLLFLLSIIVKLLFRIRYVDILKIMLYSMFPLLLFSWIPIALYALIIWSLFMFVLGVKYHKAKYVRKGSINQRD